MSTSKDNSFDNNDKIRYSIPHVVKVLCKRYPVLENNFKNHPFATATEDLSGFSYVQWSQNLLGKYSNLLISKSFLIGFRVISERKENGTHELMMTNYENTFLIFIPVPNFITSYFSKKYMQEIQVFLEKELDVKIKNVSIKDAKSMWSDDRDNLDELDRISEETDEELYKLEKKDFEENEQILETLDKTDPAQKTKIAKLEARQEELRISLLEHLEKNSG